MDLMQDVRERVIKIETRMESLPELHEDVKRHEIEIVKTKAQMKSIKWLASLILISIPASAAALIKAIKGV